MARRGQVDNPRQRARALFQRGKMAEARRAWEAVAGETPTDAEAHYMLGAIAGQEERLDDAVASFRRAVKLQPEAVVAHAGLGAALKGLGRLVEAEAAFRRVVALAPTFPEAQFELGQILLQRGKAAEAAGCFREATRLRPRWAAALHGLGDSLQAQRQFHRAIEAYRQALRVDPNLAATHFRAGLAFHAVGMLEEAVDQLEEAVRLAPEMAEGYRVLGIVLAKLGRRQEAREMYHRALEVRPEDVDTLACEADLLDQEGDFDGAYARIAPFLKPGTEHPGVGVVLANLCRHRGHCDEAVDYLERLRSQGGVRAENRSEVCFALGKLYDRAGHYEAAFDRFREANELRPFPFDARAHAATFDRLIETFDRRFFETAPRSTVASELPLFIVGLPRSGTSLVEQIIASHPDAFGAGEVGEMGLIVEGLARGEHGKGGYPDCFRHLTGKTVDRLARRYLDRVAGVAPGAVRVTDKMLQNYQHLGLIALLFPEARVVHIQRDPRDTALSIYFQYFFENLAFAADLRHIGIYYRHYRRLMAHWREVLPLPMLEVDYEALVEEPERWIREIIGFAGLPWDDCCLQFHETRRTVATLSYDQVRQPMYKQSVGRWRNYEKYLGPLLEGLGDG